MRASTLGLRSLCGFSTIFILSRCDPRLHPSPWWPLSQGCLGAHTHLTWSGRHIWQAMRHIRRAQHIQQGRKLTAYHANSQGSCETRGQRNTLLLWHLYCALLHVQEAGGATLAAGPTLLSPRRWDSDPVGACVRRQRPGPPVCLTRANDASRLSLLKLSGSHAVSSLGLASPLGLLLSTHLQNAQVSRGLLSEARTLVGVATSVESESCDWAWAQLTRQTRSLRPEQCRMRPASKHKVV